MSAPLPLLDTRNFIIKKGVRLFLLVGWGNPYVGCLTSSGPYCIHILDENRFTNKTDKRNEWDNRGDNF
jgi:hypothetical protein